MESIHPIPDDQMSAMPPKGLPLICKNESFQSQAEAFYSWYQSIRQPAFPMEGFQRLQYIMQIGEKATATEEEGNIASEQLSLLIDDLDGGKKTLDQIPYEIEKIVNHLIENNPKSRIVMQATQIEIALNLSLVEHPEDLSEVMDILLEKVNQEMPIIQAKAISYALEQGLNEEKMNSKELKEKILPLLKI